MKLWLFDIDATLISTGAAGADAMRDVFVEPCGIPDGFAGIEMSGKTEIAIFREALIQHQLDEAVVSVDVFHERYISRLRLTLQQAHRARRLMPGLPSILETLAEHPDLGRG